ncbi:hypothetical protein FHX15_001828 [Rhizobium sp. BK650]|uniref:hypothetical protein n=1 Tax=Rhizobium sp. BK650 TaxID=2586990 RepID=UPI001614BDE9|nr:hypothetical protein [Rhizobium sp. BK650]MBB3656600.1 hypothetical protein [Rhizobium sp. BK650]
MVVSFVVLYWTSALFFWVAQIIIADVSTEYCFGEPIRFQCRNFPGASLVNIALSVWPVLTLLPFYWLKPSNGPIWLNVAYAYWIAIAVGSIIVSVRTSAWLRAKLRQGA